MCVCVSFSSTKALQEDLWGSVLPGVPNPGGALHSGLGAVGACSQLCLDSWEKCTSDPWVLDIIKKGYRIQFQRRPPTFSGVHMTMVKDPVQAQILANEITTLMQKKAIVQISTSKQLTGFYSKYFLVPKKDGGLRPILDLRQLNRFIKVLPFKMLTTAQILESIEPGEWFASIDLKDAYFHVPICQDRVYQFRVLPFGLSLSPRVFTSGFSSPSSSSVCRNKNCSIPGRLVNLCSFSQSSHEGHRNGNSVCTSSRSQSKLGQEQSKSSATDGVCGDFTGLPTNDGIFISPEGDKIVQSGSVI